MIYHIKISNGERNDILDFIKIKKKNIIYLQ